MRRAAVIDLHADLTARVLDVYLAQAALHEDHEDKRREDHHEDSEDHARRQRTDTALLEELREDAWKLGHDADIDDERNPVADPARGDLLTQPHQEHRAAHERDHRRNAEEPSGIRHEVAGLHRHCKAVGLESRQRHGPVPRVLGDLATPLLAFLLELLQRTPCCRQQLNDDRGRNVRHDPQRKYAHAAERAAREHAEHPGNSACGLVHELAQGDTVNPRNRDIRSDAIDNQQSDREQQPIAQFGCLTQHAPTDIGGHLLCCRCHARPFLYVGTACAYAASGSGRSWTCRRRQGRPQAVSQLPTRT